MKSRRFEIVRVSVQVVDLFKLEYWIHTVVLYGDDVVIREVEWMADGKGGKRAGAVFAGWPGYRITSYYRFGWREYETSGMGVDFCPHFVSNFWDCEGPK
ncbi:MAG: hypothetical protein WBG50_26435 [Desulfomonilaceae bacterium]